MSRKLTNDSDIINQVVGYYMSDAFPTLAQTATHCGRAYSVVLSILRENVPADVRDQRKRANYSRSKKAEKNPAFGLRFNRLHARGRWDVASHGYIMEHRRIMAEALGLSELPSDWHVHHINNDHEDNRRDNLCLVTVTGHANLHGQKLDRLKLWEKEEFGTSRLEEIIATLQGG